MEPILQNPLPACTPKRGAGILLPVSSLPGPYGIGTMGIWAYRFVDFLQSAGQRYWQVLPVGPTDVGNSPYQSPSAFAGNPYLIDLELLCREGLLQKGRLEAIPWGNRPDRVDYSALKEYRLAVLRDAFSRRKNDPAFPYPSFCETHAHWLEDYALFMALRERFGGRIWQEWEAGAKYRHPDRMERYRLLLSEEIEFWKFVQYTFYRQWSKLRQYANRAGICLVGDIPLYVSGDSADCWSHRELFEMDASCRPVQVGGVPPDKFSEEGQNWNTPVYDWKRHEKTGFAWWKARMAAVGTLYDLIRIDHFIGLSRYFCIPGMGIPAAQGVWRTGPGEKLLRAIAQIVSADRLIAEDLGSRVAETEQLLETYGIPGMKVIQFAFDGHADNPYLPYHYTQQCVVYGGTHDNEPLKAFYENNPKARQQAARYLNLTQGQDLVWESIRMGLASVADMAIFQLQDYLGLGNEARINTPGTVSEDNWTWRVLPEALSSRLSRQILSLMRLYGRTAAIGGHSPLLCRE